MMEAVIRTDALTDHQNRLRERIKEISRLTDNWDGEEGLAPIPEVVAHANLVLEWLGLCAPGSLLDLDEHDIYPTSNGTIGFAWYIDNKLVLSIEMGKTRISYFVPKRSKTEGGLLSIRQMKSDIAVAQKIGISLFSITKQKECLR